MARARSSEVWSYCCGEKGRNRVRAFERAPRGRAETGTVFLQYIELEADGRLHRKRVSLGRCTQTVAKAKADALAGKLAGLPGRPEASEVTTVATLFDSYERERTPTKGRHAQQHDRTTKLLFLKSVGRTRPVASLNRRDWDKFIRDRRSGALRPPGTTKDHRVGDRQVQYDLKTVNAVLRWGMTVNDRRGRPLVDRHPFVGLPIPSEESPRRPRLSHADYEKMIGVADAVHPQFRLALVLAHETGHRMGAIRMLSWFDVDLKAKTIRWRAENDKIGFEHTTALTAVAVAALDAAKDNRLVEAAWVFPAPEDATKATSRYTFRHFWDRAETLAKLEPVDHRGWHSLRRAFATEMKHAPLRDLAYLGGWKSVSTVVEVYQQPDDATMRAALEARRPIEPAKEAQG